MRKFLVAFIAVLILGSSISHSAAVVVVPASSTSTTDPNPAEVKVAVAGLKALSGKEKKARIRDVKKEIKEYKAAKKAGKEPSTNTLLLVILAILLPPLAVYLHEGVINNRFWISLILTLLFWLPGVIYALVVILGD
ncbi:MAG: YqaE/Pmp3 family membrane protein [Bacteroidota bacterium]